MLDRSSIAVVLLPLILVAAHSGAQAGQNPPGCCAASNGAGQHDAPLTSTQIDALVARALESQRRDDAALAEYERIEHTVAHGNGKDVPEKETLTRVIPTGVDVMRVELARNGKPTDPATLEQEWRGVEHILQIESHPDDPVAREDRERALRRKRERAEMVDAFGKAFLFHWVGRGTLGGTTVVQFTFDPNPAYRASTRFASLYSHARGNIWIEESTAHVVRIDAQLSTDVSFGGGVFAKVYRGGRFTFEQAEVAPGVWLPAHSTYDFDGRKFVFGMAVHEQVDESDYRRIGPPEEALLLIRREHPLLFSSPIPGPIH
jgi:hypothetical protein